MTVRTRTDADLAACVRALRAVHVTSGYPRNWPSDPSGWLTEGDELGAWVAEGADGDVVGHVALTVPGADDVAPGLLAGEPAVRAVGVAVVGRLFVAPAGRGRGAGRELLGQVVRSARELAVWPVLDVVAVDPAVIFYERIGWRRLGSGAQNWGAGELVGVHCYAAPGSTTTRTGRTDGSPGGPPVGPPGGPPVGPPVGPSGA